MTHVWAVRRSVLYCRHNIAFGQLFTSAVCILYSVLSFSNQIIVHWLKIVAFFWTPQDTKIAFKPKKDIPIRWPYGMVYGLIFPPFCQGRTKVGESGGQKFWRWVPPQGEKRESVRHPVGGVGRPIISNTLCEIWLTDSAWILNSLLSESQKSRETCWLRAKGQSS